MFDDELKNLAKKVYEANQKKAKTPQGIFLMEEMSELTKEITKDFRNMGNPTNTMGEISDVLCAILTYCEEQNFNVDTIREIMISKYNKCLVRYETGVYH